MGQLDVVLFRKFLFFLNTVVDLLEDFLLQFSCTKIFHHLFDRSVDHANNVPGYVASYNIDEKPAQVLREIVRDCDVEQHCHDVTEQGDAHLIKDVDTVLKLCE